MFGHKVKLTNMQSDSGIFLARNEDDNVAIATGFFAGVDEGCLN